ncbi:hypothetical protein D7Y13_22400 [Corallococcus praedator]|uniref:Uncharacterized protein n=1 Tax=Corallococcus praedator TaxID=2316724 RepID=A0ABX9QEN6_9BACT|nr:hypothetical protein D7X74_01275 [Corallococcus sp. CA047B]RKH25916.1 hypothetical protein D7X75_29245 [Corallococcus sp. CA031C]RKI03292.1 hypothetical protein D7Y13_22400 [Corallococcus praedator]
MRLPGGLLLHANTLPEAGAEPGLEEESPAFAATVEEPRKERIPRLDWAGLLKRTFALDVFACVRPSVSGKLSPRLSGRDDHALEARAGRTQCRTRMDSNQRW